jgi:hypothetical protein
VLGKAPHRRNSTGTVHGLRNALHSRAGGASRLFLSE